MFYATRKSAIRNKEKVMADTKQQWYKDAKYGLFIHWGLYSILAGEWKDPKTGEVTKTDRIAEWIENNLNIDKED